MNKVCPVKIAGRELRLVTEEEESYVLELADRLNSDITEAVMGNSDATRFDGAILCALTAMDEAVKAQAQVRKMREDNNRLLQQIEKLRRYNGRR